MIVNGRLSHDRDIGCFTRDDTTGRSVVDYAICSPAVLNLINYFEVLCKLPESDHRPVSLSLTCSSTTLKVSKPDYQHGWNLCNKYSWTQESLDNLIYVISDNESEMSLNSLLQCITNLCDTNIIAEKFDDFISQACQRVLKFSSCNRQNNKYVPPWYDNECRHKRSLAIKAGERVYSVMERENQNAFCREYRACKQRKQREYNRKCIEDIRTAYDTNRSAMWQVINRFSHNYPCTNEPDDQEFYHHFKGLCIPQNAGYFCDEYEMMAADFLKDYDDSNNSHPINISAVEEIINDNFSVDEIECAIDSLKTNKSPGNDCIPAEFIKTCKTFLSPVITTIFNYIIDHRDFPDVWTSGIKSAVFKSGKRNIVDNFRGITILPMMEKIYELVVYRRLAFVNEAFDCYDRYNNGFLEGNRTSDNLFVLNALVEKQLVLNRRLYVSFIDFSKAFDMVNRIILFYKLISSGWKGRVIDTFRSLYGKTHFRVKRNGKLSPPLNSNLGVNQGGISSGLMFRKYMSDLSSYLSKEVGIVIANEIIAHILWADDLILFSDSPAGLQKQLDGLLKFCSNNKIIVNEMKTKSMCFGTSETFTVYFNGKRIEQVDQYRYLGVIIRSVNRLNQDIFSNNYRVISDKSRKAAFGMKKKLRLIQNLPPSIMFNIFETLVRPILTYGSDVWGMSKSGLDALDKVFLHYARCTLGVKATTCNAIVYGECGKYPPSIFCQVNVLCYLHRLLTMQNGKIVKSVFCTLSALHSQGFPTWVTKAYDLAGTYNIDMDEGTTLSPKHFKSLISERLKSTFITNWYADLQEKPLLRSYRLYKREFIPECYLDCITLPKYRIPISKIRASSHDLAIERGRHTRPKIDPDQRLCMYCLEIENEEHFVINCHINIHERQKLFTKICSKFPAFAELNSHEKFIYLMSCKDSQILTWFGKFLCKSFDIRNSKIHGSCIPSE